MEDTEFSSSEVREVADGDSQPPHAAVAVMTPLNKAQGSNQNAQGKSEGYGQELGFNNVPTWIRFLYYITWVSRWVREYLNYCRTLFFGQNS